MGKKGEMLIKRLQKTLKLPSAISVIKEKWRIASYDKDIRGCPIMN